MVREKCEKSAREEVIHSGLFQIAGPVGGRLREFGENGGVGLPGTFEDVKAVVRGFKDVERREVAEFFDDRPEEFEIRKRVPCSLQKEHGHWDFGEMVGALGRRTARRMERETKEHEAANIGKQVLRGGLRGHPAAHGFSSGEQRKAGRHFATCAKRGGYRRGEYRGGIGSADALLHIRELITESGNLQRGEFAREALHERMADSGSRAMGEQQQPPCVVGMEEQRRDFAGALHGKCERNTLLHSGNLSRPLVSQRVFQAMPRGAAEFRIQ